MGSRLAANSLILPHLASPLGLNQIADKITKWCQCSLWGQNHSMHQAGFPDEGTVQLSLGRSLDTNHRAHHTAQRQWKLWLLCNMFWGPQERSDVYMEKLDKHFSVDKVFIQKSSFFEIWRFFHFNSSQWKSFPVFCLDNLYISFIFPFLTINLRTHIYHFRMFWQFWKKILFLSIFLIF